MGLIPQSPTAARPRCALGLILADDSASNCRGGTTVVRMLARKCLFVLKKKKTHSEPGIFVIFRNAMPVK